MIFYKNSLNFKKKSCKTKLIGCVLKAAQIEKLILGLNVMAALKISCIIVLERECEFKKTYLAVTMSQSCGLVKNVTIIILM
jgi:hypothetical protein